MTIRSWFLAGFLVVLAVVIGGLGLTSYLLYHQTAKVDALGKQTRRLAMRSDRLEGMLREQETRIILTQQAVKAINPKTAQEPPEKKPAAPEPPKEKSKTKPAPPAAKPKPEPKPEPKPQAKAPAAKPEPAAEKPKEQPLQAEPTESKHAALRRVVQSMIGGHLVIGFDVVNKAEPSEPVAGYAMVVVRGQRVGKPWIEAWPPMKLSPLGRPVNYRRGTPFSAQRFRRLRARFVLADKKLNRLEVLIYNRKGEVILISHEKINMEGS